MSIATASDLEIAPARPLLMPLASAAACVALADWLLYGWEIGISLALLLGVLCLDRSIRYFRLEFSGMAPGAIVG